MPKYFWFASCMRRSKHAIPICSCCILAIILGILYVQTLAPIDQPYEYPITQSDPEWSSLSTSEKKSLCQIETSVLRRLTTPALLETVLNYPYLIDVFAWGDMSIGIETLAANFNGMEELLARADLERSLEDYCNTHSSHNIAYQVAEDLMQNNI